MDVPTSEVGYTSAMPRREVHEVRKGHVGHWIKKKTSIIYVETKVRIFSSLNSCLQDVLALAATVELYV